MSWFGFALCFCIAIVAISGLTNMFAYFEMIAQIQVRDRAFEVALWGRPSWGELTRVHRTHRLYFPSSRLRTIYWVSQAGVLCPFLVAILLVLNHPGSPSR